MKYVQLIHWACEVKVISTQMVDWIEASNPKLEDVEKKILLGDHYTPTTLLNQPNQERRIGDAV